MFLKKISLALCVTVLFAPMALQAKADLPAFNQVVIWGHPLHSHTHSYIHWAFERAFKHLGYKVYWLSDNDNIRDIDFSNSLFITEGQVDKRIPLRNDCRYIIHNCNIQKYKQLLDNGNCIILQVYTHDCLDRNDTYVAPCTYMDLPNKVIYMPWATDLLPHEIDTIKKNIHKQKHEKAVYMVGSISGDDMFGNAKEYDAFKRACLRNDIAWRHPSNLSMEDNIKVTQKSYIAPAIQGKWQCLKGYVPCRIFKNISYGQWGATNSETVWKLFKQSGINIIYNEDTYQLFYDAAKKAQEGSIEELYKQMDFVRDHHTYLNRIETLFWFMNQVKPLP